MPQVLKHKIPFEHFGEVFSMMLPNRADLLTVQMQGGVAMLWTIGNPDNFKAEYRFVIFRTGQDMPHSLTKADFIATWQNESLVMHMFRAPR